jgi:hypothetical protein
MDKNKCMDSIMNEDMLHISSSLIENSKSLTQLIDTLYKNYFNNLIGKCFYYKELDLIIRFDTIISIPEFVHDLIIDGNDYNIIVAAVTVKHKTIDNSIFDCAKKNMSLKEFSNLFFKLIEANKEENMIMENFNSYQNHIDSLKETREYLDNYLNLVSHKILNNQI